MSILYFIPRSVQRAELPNLLPGRLSDSVSMRQTIKGPLGLSAGTILASGDAPRLELNIAEQDWHMSADKAFAFGWWKDAVPVGSDFLIDEPVPGTIVNGWLVPRVRKQHLVGDQIMWGTTLPRKPRWDGSRFEAGDVCDRFAHLVEISETVNNMLQATYLSDDNWLRLPEDAAAWCAKIIQINHRIGCDELAQLGAFEMSFHSLVEILRVFVSWDMFESLLESMNQKKTLTSG